jgi:hypothetical protein
VWEDPNVSISTGKHRSVQLKQIRMQRFNNIYTPVGLAAQAACGDYAGCAGVVYVLELSLSIFIRMICFVL